MRPPKAVVPAEFASLITSRDQTRKSLRWSSHAPSLTPDRRKVELYAAPSSAAVTDFGSRCSRRRAALMSSVVGKVGRVTR